MISCVRPILSPFFCCQEKKKRRHNQAHSKHKQRGRARSFLFFFLYFLLHQNCGARLTALTCTHTQMAHFHFKFTSSTEPFTANLWDPCTHFWIFFFVCSLCNPVQAKITLVTFTTQTIEVYTVYPIDFSQIKYKCWKHAMISLLESVKNKSNQKNLPKICGC